MPILEVPAGEERGCQQGTGDTAWGQGSVGYKLVERIKIRVAITCTIY